MTPAYGDKQRAKACSRPALRAKQSLAMQDPWLGYDHRVFPAFPTKRKILIADQDLSLRLGFHLAFLIQS